MKNSSYIEYIIKRVTLGDNKCGVKSQRPIQLCKYDIKFDIFALHLTSLGKSERTIKNYLMTLKDFDNEINEKTLPNFAKYIKFNNIPKVSSRKRKVYRMYLCLQHYLWCTGNKKWSDLLPDKRLLTSPQHNPKIAVFKDGEIDYIINNAEKKEQHQYVMLLKILRCTGLRISEILQLRVKNITWSTTPVEIKVFADESKSKINTIVYLTDKVSKELKQYIKNKEDKDYLFIFMPELMTKKRKSTSYIEREQLEIIFELRKLSPIRIKELISPHWFRHNYAQKLNDIDVPLIQIKRLMRHISVATTESYIHIDAEEVKKVYKKSEKLFD